MSRVLITGGAGFIGSHVAEAFLAAGHDVSIVDNLATGRRENLPPGRASSRATSPMPPPWTASSPTPIPRSSPTSQHRRA